MKQKYFLSAMCSAYSEKTLRESLEANIVLLNDLLSMPGVNEYLALGCEEVAKAQTAVLHFLHEAEFVGLNTTEEDIEKTINEKIKERKNK